MKMHCHNHYFHPLNVFLGVYRDQSEHLESEKNQTHVPVPNGCLGVPNLIRNDISMVAGHVMIQNGCLTRYFHPQSVFWGMHRDQSEHLESAKIKTSHLYQKVVS